MRRARSVLLTLPVRLPVRLPLTLPLTLLVVLFLTLLPGCRVPGVLDSEPRPVPRPGPSQPAPPRPETLTVTVMDLVADVRREPEEGTELLTQALFNEKIELLGDSDGWYWVKVPDGYEGWMKTEALGRFSEQESPWSGVSGRVYAARPTVSLYSEPRGKGKQVKSVYLGTPLGVVEKEADWLAVRLAGIGRAWVSARDVLAVEGVRVKPGAAPAVLATARLLLGVPYLWGGNSPRGYDCSGLVYEVYKIHGIKLPRDADQQFKEGRKVDRDKLAPGDLVFFSSGEGTPSHVAIFAGKGEVIEAVKAGGVKVSTLKDAATRLKYLGARRVIP